MPSVHYGRLPGEVLMDLWQTESCQFYRDKFKQRVEKYDRILMDDLLGTSGENRLTLLQKAHESMPEPPEGCNVY